MSAPATMVIGGGIAGAAAALRLARAGARPLLVEKTEGPHHKVCGEFLSVETVAELRALGVEPAALGAVSVTRLRLVNGRRLAEIALPFAAMSLSRMRLDEALLEHAAASGARVERGVRVPELGSPPSGGLFVATGKHVLRGVAAGRPSGYVGYKMHYRVSACTRAALERAVELILTPRGYAGLQLVEGGIANLCLLTRRPARGALEAAVAATPRLNELLGDAEPLFARPLTVAGLPYGHIAQPEGQADGRYLLGDQAAMIPSFTGDGMGIALATARWAASAWERDGKDGVDRYARAMAARVRRPVGLAGRIANVALQPGLAGMVVAACRYIPGLARAAARGTRVELPA